MEELLNGTKMTKDEKQPLLDNFKSMCYTRSLEEFEELKEKLCNIPCMLKFIRDNEDK